MIPSDPALEAVLSELFMKDFFERIKPFLEDYYDREAYGIVKLEVIRVLPGAGSRMGIMGGAHRFSFGFMRRNG